MPTQTPLRQTKDQQKITNQAKKCIYLLTPMARQITHTKNATKDNQTQGQMESTIPEKTQQASIGETSNRKPYN